MKRLLPIILLLLLLTGCDSGDIAPETTAPTAAPTEPTAPPVSLYDADSEAEAATSGAVRAYPLGEETYVGIYPMGEKVLLQSSDGVLTLLQGDNGEVVATVATQLTQEDSQVAVGDSWVYYYLPENREVVYLDEKLQEQQRVLLPKEVQGKPLLQARGQVFYCEGSDIRAFDLATGVSRLVRQHNCMAQALTGSYFGDTVIGCRVVYDTDHVELIYISADTGEKFPSDTSEHTFVTGGDYYFGVCPENTEHPYVYGNREGEAMCLYPDEENLLPLLEVGMVGGCTADYSGLTITGYDLETGRQSAQVKIPGAVIPEAYGANEAYVYLVSQGVLYRWDPKSSPMESEEIYAGPRYTANQPDIAGIADCKLRAQQLLDNYGLRLYLWDEAKALTGEYCLADEYRVSVITGIMDELEAMVKSFPEGFLSKANVSFYLVQSMPEGENKAQYWDANGCHVVLTVENTMESFLWGLGFAIDTYVLNHCRDFDNWDNFNPKNFEYTYDYAENALREDWEDDLDYFIDLESMSFPTEDRSRIFMYSLLPEGKEYFQERKLQEKLEQVCEAIREAYEWERTTEVYPWEQYLEKKLAKDA